MELSDLFLPLLLPPPPPTDPNAPRYDPAYAGAFRASDGGSGALLIDALQAGALPGTDTVVTPQAGTVTLLTVTQPDGTPKPPDTIPTLPDGAPVTADTVLLRVGTPELAAYRAALSGRPTPAQWTFSGIDAASFATQVEQWAAAASQQELDTAVPPGTADDQRAAFKERILQGGGDFEVWLDSGAALGDLDSGFRLGVRIYDDQNQLVHPAIVLPDFDDANPALLGHPLIAAVEAVDIDTQIFLQFRYLKVDNATRTPTAAAPKAAFAPLDGATVEVVNAFPDNVLGTGTTDADGRVTFFVSNLDWSFLAGTADIYFRVAVDPANAIIRQWGRTATWSGTWSTWRPGGAIGVADGFVAAIGGQDGYYPDYAGWALGTESAPLIFNLGTPVVLAASYEASKTWATPAGWRTVPRGTEIDLGLSIGGRFLSNDIFYADSQGEVWGTAFDLFLGNEIEVTLPLVVADDIDTAAFIDSIELPPIIAFWYPTAWEGRDHDPTNLSWVRFGASAIGDPAKPKPLPVRVDQNPNDDIAATLYLFKCFRDVHLWFHTITGGEWKGVKGCWVHLRDAFPGSWIDFITSKLPSNNPPYLGVLLRNENKWDRDTCLHEVSHGVMWGLTTIGLEDFACAIAEGRYGNHWTWEATSEFTALVEGWADLAANALGVEPRPFPEGICALPLPPSEVWNSHDQKIPIGSVPVLGRTVEGCFASAFWNWLHGELHVEPCVETDLPDLQRRDSSGKPVANDTIATADDAFMKALWKPVKDLSKGTNVPGVTELLANTGIYMDPASFQKLSQGYLIPWALSA